MSPLSRLRRWLASKISPASPAVSKRAYAGAMINRLTSDWIAQSTSYDAELKTSLRVLRNRTRELIRDNDYAKHAINTIKNNVIGCGMGMQVQVPMQRGEGLNDKLNTDIETAYRRWCRKKTCDVAGKLSFMDIERVVLGAVAESGEVLVRKVRQRFGGGKIPFALELIEADRLVDFYSLWKNPETGNAVRMGVEVDQWQRPVAYWLWPYHPGDMEFSGAVPVNRLMRVPADEIIHLYVPTRPGATRGVPWFHSALIRLNHLRGYEEAEIIAARAAACIMGFIKSNEPENPSANDQAVGSGVGDDVVDGERVTDMAPAQIRELAEGEDFIGFNPSRPNSGADPFIKQQLRGVAAGVDMSYESLTGDYSQSNFSSSRMGWVAERDQWRVLQAWMAENFHQEVYEAWLEMAVLAGVVNAPAYETMPELYAEEVQWMPRGWGYIDPLKDVQADRMAVRAGFKTQSQVLNENGSDLETWSKQRRRELDVVAEEDLVVESDPAQVDLRGQVQTSDPVEENVDAPAEAPAADAAGDGAAAGGEGKKSGPKVVPLKNQDGSRVTVVFEKGAFHVDGDTINVEPAKVVQPSETEELLERDPESLEITRITRKVKA
jgi:lambda family phage portal protein